MWTRGILLLLTLFNVLLARSLVGELPDKVAVHFRADGYADGWMPKAQHLHMLWGLQLGVTVTFLVMGLVVRAVPASMLSLPNRDYWLEPARERETRGRVDRFATRLGWWPSLFITWLSISMNEANQVSPAYFDPARTLQGILLLLVMVLGDMLFFGLSFRLPEAEKLRRSRR